MEKFVQINRSPSLIDKDTFRHLTELNMKYAWLQEKPDALFELWTIADNNVQQELIDFLLSQYKVIDEKTLNSSLNLMAKQIYAEWGLNSSSTKICAICDSNEPDGSQFILQMMKNKFPQGWKQDSFINSYMPGLHALKNGDALVFVDDFIGTGNTIERKTKYAQKFLKQNNLDKVTIYIVSLAAMRFSQAILGQLGIVYYSQHWLLKGISESTEEPLRSQYITAMKDMENKLQKRINGHTMPSLGYQQSEALFCIGDLNVPNNVFPVFWWPRYRGGFPRETLFQRI